MSALSTLDTVPARLSARTVAASVSAAPCGLITDTVLPVTVSPTDEPRSSDKDRSSPWSVSRSKRTE